MTRDKDDLARPDKAILCPHRVNIAITVCTTCISNGEDGGRAALKAREREKDWWIARARLEGDSEVTAGVSDPVSSEAPPGKKPAVVDPYGKRLHHLKTWPFPFNDVVAGLKPFEYRPFDRDFRVGDTLVLEKYDPDTKTYRGASVDREVTYVLPGGTFGVPDGYCVLGLKEPRHPLEDRRERDRHTGEEDKVRALRTALALVGEAIPNGTELDIPSDTARLIEACMRERRSSKKKGM